MSSAADTTAALQAPLPVSSSTPLVAPPGTPAAIHREALRPASLDEAIALADSAASVREAASLLRTRCAPLKVIVVDAFDMREEPPAAVGSKRVLWGASSDGHCWQVTQDLTQVAGFYLAEKD